MNLRFTKYAFTNILWSFIPIFPTWTLFPGVALATGIEGLLGNCEFSYQVILGASITLCIVVPVIFKRRLESVSEKSEKSIKRSFRNWSLLLYTMANTAGFIFIIGAGRACDAPPSMVINTMLYSAIVAMSSLLLFGIFVDISLKKTGANTRYN